MNSIATRELLESLTSMRDALAHLRAAAYGQKGKIPDDIECSPYHNDTDALDQSECLHPVGALSAKGLSRSE